MIIYQTIDLYNCFSYKIYYPGNRSKLGLSCTKILLHKVKSGQNWTRALIAQR